MICDNCRFKRDCQLVTERGQCRYYQQKQVEPNNYQDRDRESQQEYFGKK